MVYKEFTLHKPSEIDTGYLIDNGTLSEAIPYKNVVDSFGVEKGILGQHPSGLVSEDSLLEIMLQPGKV